MRAFIRTILLTAMPLLIVTVSVRLASHPDDPHSTLDSLLAAAEYVQADSVVAEILQKLRAEYGAEDVRLVPWFLEAGSIRCEMGRYTEAGELFQRALEIESARGPEGRPGALAALRGLARTSTGLGELSEAETLVRRSGELSRELHGPRSVPGAEDLSILAEIRIDRDRLGEAADLLDEAIGLIEKRWGSTHESLADMLRRRAFILNVTGRHNEALPLLERSRAIAAERWGPDHPEAAKSLSGIASIHNKRGEFSKAEKIYRECFDILERAFGPAHPVIAETAADFGDCLTNLGRYVEVEEILRRHLEATTAVYGESNGRSGVLMLKLAEVLATLGRQVESARLFRRAASIMEEVYGPNHTRYAASLSGLAHLKRRSGNNPEAEPLYRRCIRIVEENHGSPHPDLIHYRCRLGMCLLQGKKLDEAFESIERGIAEASVIYGAGSYQVAVEERHLGMLVSRMRALEGYSILKRSLATMEKYFGPDHHYLSKCLKGLAQTGHALGLREEAHAYIDRAVALHEHISGRDQIELAHLLSVKTGIEMNLHMWDAAVATSLRGAELSLIEVEDIYQVADAREAMCYVSLCYGNTYSLLNAATIHPALPDSMLIRIFPLVVKTQGHVLDWLAERQEFLKSAEDTSLIKQLRNNYVNATQLLTDLLVRGPGNDLNTYRERVAAARRKHDQADLALSAASEQLRRLIESGGSGRRVSTEALASALDAGETLVQFICYYKLAELVSGEVVWTPRNRQYGAFRLHKTGASSWDLAFVDLGRAGSIDSLVFDYRRIIDQMKPGCRPSAREETEYRTIAHRLYEKVWAPVIPLMDEMASTGIAADSAAMVFIVPDSWLHLLDFNSLLAPTDELVIERWKVHHLSSGDDLLHLPTERPGGTGLLTVGNPTRSSDDFAKSPNGGRIEARSSAILCDEAYHTPAPLPGAEKETRAVAELFSAATDEPATVLLGPEATEASVKRHFTGKRAVHIATHGFFCEESDRTDRATVERIKNPLLMSGLVLACDSPENDGLLTAQEVVGLDLRGLDWVVLSACGSGLGRLFRGEGLFGLRRAFEIAGARTIITALWRIDDAAVRDLMVDIYRFRLGGDSTVDAVRRAQLERLRGQRRRLNRIHPILWGGIIAQGDWR